MSEQQSLLKSSTGTSPKTSGLQSLQEPFDLSSQSWIQLQEVLEHTQSTLEQHQKDRFYTFIAYQRQKQQYRALQYANECAQIRKLVQTIQKHHYRLACLHQQLLSATTEEECVKLRTCTGLIIQTLHEHLETASPPMQQHLVPLIELLAAHQQVDTPQPAETTGRP